MIASLLYRLSDNNPLREEEHYQLVSPPHRTLLNELKMLLMSRAQLPYIEDIPRINISILNYGINGTFSNIDEKDSRRLILEARLKNAIARFEPRLSQVTLTGNADNSHVISFILRGFYISTPIALELTWNDCSGRFYFNE